jgi:hypothetical protein
LHKNIEVDGSWFTVSHRVADGIFCSSAKDVTITVRDLKSKPYIDLTESTEDGGQMSITTTKHFISCNSELQME